MPSYGAPAGLAAGSSASPTVNMLAAKLTHWRAALGAMRAGVRSAKILMVGDSTYQGYGSAADGFGTPGFLAAELNARGLTAQRGLLTPTFPGAGHAVDPRVTYGTGWALGQVAGGWWGGNGYYFQGLAGGAGTCVVAPGVVCDHFDVYYWQSAGLGTVNVQATGGALTPLNTAGADGIGKLTVAAGSNSAANTVTFSGAATAAVVIVGVEPWSSVTPAILVGNAGQGTTTTASWVNTSAGQHDSIACIIKYAPDLTVIDLAINDAVAGAGAASVLANLETLAAAAQFSGDVILKTMTPSSANTALEAAYVAAMQTSGLPVIDTFTRWGGPGGYATLNPLGYYFDTFHPSQAGYDDQAAQVAAALCAV